MSNWLNDSTNLSDLIGAGLKGHLTIEADWFGDPKTSTFGIHINLMWDYDIISSTVVNFINE